MRSSRGRSDPTIRGQNDQTLLVRVGQSVALQASAALAAVLLVVGVSLYLIDVRVQSEQIRTQLETIASTVDDVEDPPSGTAVALRGADGSITVSAHAPAVTPSLLDKSPGYVDVSADGVDYRGLISENSHGIVVVLLDLDPFDTGRRRLLIALALAEVVGIATSAGVVLLLSRRSIQPLARALQLQRRFVADASHELRAPLTVLHTRAQMLARRTDRLSESEIREQLNGIVDDTRALGDVVEDMLMSASLEGRAAGRTEIDLATLAEDVRASMAAHATTLGIELIVERRPEDGGGPVVTGSPPALRRAIVSLVDNALTHERPGGVVRIRVLQDKQDAMVAVVDSGVGVEPELADKLFARFAHGSTQPAGGRRYGIGLALVREIAQAHDGDVVVSATPGGGATFTMRISHHS